MNTLKVIITVILLSLGYFSQSFASEISEYEKYKNDVILYIKDALSSADIENHSILTIEYHIENDHIIVFSSNGDENLSNKVVSVLENKNLLPENKSEGQIFKIKITYRKK